MPCPSADQGEWRPGKEEKRNISFSSQHIPWVWKASASFFWSLKKIGTDSKFPSSQEKMEMEVPKLGTFPQPKLLSRVGTVFWPTFWDLEEITTGENNMPRLQCESASNYRVVEETEASTNCSPTSPSRHQFCLAAASPANQPSKQHEEYSCEYGSPMYFVLCCLGGVLSCGLTHTAVVPLDVVKCRMQVDPKRYRGLLQGFGVAVQDEGARGLVKGWAPTLIGYSMQGLGKFGLYEYFKIRYSNMMGPEQAYLWRTSLYLAASASAEFFADIALSPMEAVKVRIQTQHGYANTLREAVPKMYLEEGLWAFYKGVSPLWMRQIPYTMMKFACFERTVEALYKFVVPKPQHECSKMEQLGVTFVGGYIAGIFCAVISHPADSVVSVLNKEKGSTAIGVLKKLGIYGIWKGLFIRILMIGTLTALQWFIYDSVKVYLRLPRPPPPEMPESLKKKLSGK